MEIPGKGLNAPELESPKCDFILPPSFFKIFFPLFKYLPFPDACFWCMFSSESYRALGYLGNWDTN